MDKSSLSLPAFAVCTGILSVLLLAITIQTSPSYELSIYASLNPYAFVPFAIALAFSYLWVVRGRLWAFTLMTMILCVANVVLISLPLIKGYYMYGQSDASDFIGYVVDIIGTNHTFHDDFYPLAHVLAAQLSLILGIEPRFVFSLLTPFMWAFFALATALSVKQLDVNRHPLATGTARALACVFWLPRFFSYSYPYFVSLELIAIVMYLLLGKQSFSKTICLVILCIAIPFYHPLTSIVLAASFLVASFFVSRPHSSIFRSIAAATGVVMGAWMIYFDLFTKTFRYLLLSFVNEPDIQIEVVQSLNKLHLTLFGTVELAAITYGLGGLAVCLAALSYPVFVKLVKRNGQLKTGLRIMFSFALLNIALTVLGLLGGDLGFTPFRFYWFAVLSTLPAAIWTTVYLINRLRDVRVARFVAATLIILLWSSSIISLFPSPYMLIPNDQVSRQIISPVQWLHAYHPSYQISNPPFNAYSVEQMYKSVAGWQQSDTQYNNLSPNLPDHLKNVTAAYKTRYFPLYLVYDASVPLIYEKLYPSLLRYTPADVPAFVANTYVGKIYDNGESQVLLVF